MMVVLIQIVTGAHVMASDYDDGDDDHNNDDDFVDAGGDDENDDVDDEDDYNKNRDKIITVNC